MSGHSKWHNIKFRKERVDAQKGKIFSKMAKVIAMAARSGSQANLDEAVEKAKEANMPKINIERAIKRGTGEEKTAALEEVTYEVIGPFGLGLLIETITDNKNRTLGEIKQILKKHNANLGGVSWMFENKNKPKYTITLTPQQREQVEKLFDELDEQEDAQEIYSNLAENL